MAQRVQIILEDDLDGGLADETVLFGLDGVPYEIDLNKGNAQKLRELLAPYVKKGRKPTRQGTASSRPPRSSGQPKVMRDWAKANGLSVEGRGRIPGPIKEAFDAYQQGDESRLEELKKMPLYSDTALLAGQDEEDPGAPEQTDAPAEPDTQAPGLAPVDISDEERQHAAELFKRKKVSERQLDCLRAARDNGGEFVRQGSSVAAVIKALERSKLGTDGRINGAGLAYLELVEAAQLADA
ncbi:Lsr2 family protein [Kitasatospora sp. NPDC052896]|uniref:Lsr2 family protein n=1 Tax=Kitasatospora sp. NPDC052896 TaxID=3364061 RepID=UPI0037CB1843